MPSLPPSFHGDASLYAFAIFGTLAVASLSVTSLASLFVAARARPEHWRNPVSMHRAGLAGLYLTCLLGMAPDVAFMLAYGEVSDRTLLTVSQVDRILDAACAIPFIVGSAFFAVANHAITFQLIRQPIPVDLWPTLPQLARAARIAGLCLLIALGVAFTK